MVWSFTPGGERGLQLAVPEAEGTGTLQVLPARAGRHGKELVLPPSPPVLRSNKDTSRMQRARHPAGRKAVFARDVSRLLTKAAGKVVLRLLECGLVGRTAAETGSHVQAGKGQRGDPNYSGLSFSPRVQRPATTCPVFTAHHEHEFSSPE